MYKFTVGKRVRLAAGTAAEDFRKRHSGLTGPFQVKGTHPKGDNNEGLVCIQLSADSGDVAVVNAEILQPT